MAVEDFDSIIQKQVHFTILSGSTKKSDIKHYTYSITV